jgi:pentatricopeptide repeat protein
VVAGLVKEKSLEMALDKLEEMRSRGITPLPWLYDLIMYALAEEQHFDETLSVLQRRAADGDMAISETLWYYLLDVSSREQSVRPTHFAMIYFHANRFA